MNSSAIVQKLWNYCNVLRDGDEPFDHYRHTLEKLGAATGPLGLIFGKALAAAGLLVEDARAKKVA